MAIIVNGIRVADIGVDGLGVPSGGTTGQILAKASNTDNDTEWIDAPSDGGSSTGDMQVSVYDPQNKAQDIFAYVDNAIQTAVTSSWEASY